MTTTTTGSQDNSFWKQFFDEMLDRDVTWVLEWAQETFEVADIFDINEIIDAVREKCGIDDIFTEIELEEWALSNGFVREN